MKNTSATSNHLASQTQQQKDHQLHKEGSYVDTHPPPTNKKNTSLAKFKNPVVIIKKIRNELKTEQPREITDRIAQEKIRELYNKLAEEDKKNKRAYLQDELNKHFAKEMAEHKITKEKPFRTDSENYGRIELAKNKSKDGGTNITLLYRPPTTKSDFLENATSLLRRARHAGTGIGITPLEKGTPDQSATSDDHLPQPSKSHNSHPSHTDVLSRGNPFNRAPTAEKPSTSHPTRKPSPTSTIFEEVKQEGDPSLHYLKIKKGHYFIVKDILSNKKTNIDDEEYLTVKLKDALKKDLSLQKDLNILNEKNDPCLNEKLIDKLRVELSSSDQKETEARFFFQKEEDLPLFKERLRDAIFSLKYPEITTQLYRKLSDLLLDEEKTQAFSEKLRKRPAKEIAKTLKNITDKTGAKILSYLPKDKRNATLLELSKVDLIPRLFLLSTKDQDEFFDVLSKEQKKVIFKHLEDDDRKSIWARLPAHAQEALSYRVKELGFPSWDCCQTRREPLKRTFSLPSGRKPPLENTPDSIKKSATFAGNSNLYTEAIFSLETADSTVKKASNLKLPSSPPDEISTKKTGLGEKAKILTGNVLRRTKSLSGIALLSSFQKSTFEGKRSHPLDDSSQKPATPRQSILRNAHTLPRFKKNVVFSSSFEAFSYGENTDSQLSRQTSTKSMGWSRPSPDHTSPLNDDCDNDVSIATIIDETDHQNLLTFEDSHTPTKQFSHYFSEGTPGGTTPVLPKKSSEKSSCPDSPIARRSLTASSLKDSSSEKKRLPDSPTPTSEEIQANFSQQSTHLIPSDEYTASHATHLKRLSETTSSTVLKTSTETAQSPSRQAIWGETVCQRKLRGQTPLRFLTERRRLVSYAINMAFERVRYFFWKAFQGHSYEKILVTENSPLHTAIQGYIEENKASLDEAAQALQLFIKTRFIPAKVHINTHLQKTQFSWHRQRSLQIFNHHTGKEKTSSFLEEIVFSRGKFDARKQTNTCVPNGLNAPSVAPPPPDLKAEDIYRKQYYICDSPEEIILSDIRTKGREHLPTPKFNADRLRTLKKLIKEELGEYTSGHLPGDPATAVKNLTITKKIEDGINLQLQNHLSADIEDLKKKEDKALFELLSKYLPMAPKEDNQTLSNRPCREQDTLSKRGMQANSLWDEETIRKNTSSHITSCLFNRDLAKRISEAALKLEEESPDKKEDAKEIQVYVEKHFQKNAELLDFLQRNSHPNTVHIEDLRNDEKEVIIKVKGANDESSINFIIDCAIDYIKEQPKRFSQSSIEKGSYNTSIF